MRQLVLGVLLVLGVFTTGAIAADDFPPLRQESGDAELPNSCSPQELPELREQVLRIAGHRQPDVAWKLASAVLCGTGRAFERLALAHLPKRILSIASGSGQENTKQWIRPSEAIHSMCGSEAWAATVEAGESPDEIVVSAWTDPVSITAFVFRFRYGQWLWVAISRASD